MRKPALDRAPHLAPPKQQRRSERKGHRRRRKREREVSTHVVDECNTLDVQMLAVERVLEKLDDVLADRVLGGKALGPSEKEALVECSLLDREGECEAEGQIGIRRSGRRRICGGVLCKESIDRVGHVVCRDQIRVVQARRRGDGGRTE